MASCQVLSGAGDETTAGSGIGFAQVGLSYTVQGSADLSVAMSEAAPVADVARAAAAGRSRFSEKIVVSNAGPATATDVVTGLLWPDAMSVTNSDRAARVGHAIYWTANRIVPHAHVAYTVTFDISRYPAGEVQMIAAAASMQVKDPATATMSPQPTGCSYPGSGGAWTATGWPTRWRSEQESSIG